MIAICRSELMSIKIRLRFGTVDRHEVGMDYFHQFGMTDSHQLGMADRDRLGTADRAALDKKQGSLILFETRRISFAGKGFVHAQNPRGPATVGPGLDPAADRPQLLDRPIHRTPLPETGRGRRALLAAAGRPH